jgi:hypothetical protein
MTKAFKVSIAAPSFVKSGGASNQYLMADGSVTTGSSTTSMNYAQTQATKQSNISTSGVTIVSTSITTGGNPVQVLVTGDAENTVAGGWIRLQLFRGTTAIGKGINVESSAASENIPYAITVIDTPTAGTYTYSLQTITAAATGAFNFGEIDGPVLTAIELNTLLPTTNLSLTGTVSADQVAATNNGNGTNFKVGDDAWIGDINTSNTLSIRGQQSSSLGYIRLGSDTNSFGYNGTNLVYGTTIIPSSGGTLATTGQTFYIGTQAIAINQGTGTITALPGVTSVNGTTIPNAVTLLNSTATGVQTFLTTPSSANLAGAITDETGSGSLVFGTGPTLSLPIIDNIKIGYTTTVTAAGTTTLTSASNFKQYFTGTTTQTVVLPVVSTLALGMAYEINNNSTGTITVQSSGLNTIATIPAGLAATFTVILITGTTAASWDYEFSGFNTITGTGSAVLSTSPTITTPLIDTINTNTGAATAAALWSDITTGSISIGSGVTSGSISIGNANQGTSITKTVNIMSSGSASGTMAVNIATANGAANINIGTYPGIANSKTINIGTSSTGGTTAITIGSNSGATSTIQLNGSITLGSLLTAGFVKTSAAGLLSVDTNTYLTSTTGVTTVNGASGAIANIAVTNANNNFSTSQTVTGTVTATNIVKSGGTSSQYLMADGSVSTGYVQPDIIPLDNLQYKFDGKEQRFLPTYQGSQVAINNPLRLLLSINGIIQTVSFPENTWLSGYILDGFYVDSDGYLSFTEVPPEGSIFDGRLMAGPDTQSTYQRNYPFRPVDILLGV